MHEVSALHRSLALVDEFHALGAWLDPLLASAARFDPIAEEHQLHHDATLGHLQTRPDRIEAEVEGL